MAHAFLQRPSAAGAWSAYPLTLAVHAIIARGDAAETAAARRAGSGWLGDRGAMAFLQRGAYGRRYGRELIDNACVQGEAPSAGSLRPAAAGARHDCVRSSITLTDVRRGIRRLQHRNRVASRGASGGRRVQNPSPDRTPDDARPMPGTPMTTTHKDYPAASASSSAPSNPTTSAKPASAAASPAQSLLTAITFDQ